MDLALHPTVQRHLIAYGGAFQPILEAVLVELFGSHTNTILLGTVAGKASLWSGESELVHRKEHTL